METENAQVEYCRVRRIRRTWVFVFLFLLTLLYFAYNALTIRHLLIYTINRIPAGEVAMSAGLDRRVNYLTVNEKTIKEGIDSNRYLIYKGMKKVFPDTLVLYIKERTVCSSVKHNGIQYLMDDQGMVLERNTALSLDDTAISVTGLDLREIQTGRTIICRQAGQLEAYAILMAELKMQDFFYDVSAVNLSDVENIYLITHSGYTVTVGDSGQMRAKIGTVRAVILKLQEMGKTGGMIEAGVPGVATYSPDDALNMRDL